MSRKKDYPIYVVNTNTNIIFKYVENVNYISKKDHLALTNKNGIKQARKSNQSTKWVYARVRPTGELDFNKTSKLSVVRKHISQGYVVECKNYTQALYYQAKLRYDKTDVLRNKEEWKEVMERILEESPECLI
jgi:hypothetical protein